MAISSSESRSLRRPSRKIAWSSARRTRICCLVLAMSTEDRKSTRLNSSHLVISYAVFCLKKKKKNNTRLQHWTIMSPHADAQFALGVAFCHRGAKTSVYHTSPPARLSLHQSTHRLPTSI